MLNKKETIDKIYFTMGEVGQITGLAHSAIRYYQSEFRLEIRRKRSGKRVFHINDLNKFKWISVAADIYKLDTIRLAFMLFPDERFSGGLLTPEEQQRILKKLEDEKIPTP